jgi:hypothetical protein
MKAIYQYYIKLLQIEEAVNCYNVARTRGMPGRKVPIEKRWAEVEMRIRRAEEFRIRNVLPNLLAGPDNKGR